MRSIRQGLAGALCLVVLTASMSSAHAQGSYHLKAAFRAGPVLDTRLSAGDEQIARQVIALFVNTIHGYFENAAGRSAWMIWNPHLDQVLLVTDQIGPIEGAPGFAVWGEAMEGPLAGCLITLVVVRRPDQQVVVVTRVQHRALDVMWKQPFEPLPGHSAAPPS